MPRVDNIRKADILLYGEPFCVLQEEQDYVTETSAWRFIPDYQAIERIAKRYPIVWWVPGIDLSLHKPFYYRDHVPSFVRDRIMPKSRPDVQDFLKAHNIPCYDPFEMMIATEGCAGVDPFRVRRHVD